MKELDQFTVERLEELSNARMISGHDIADIRALARIALSAKQAEPIYQYQSGIGNDFNGGIEWVWDDCDKGFYGQYDHARRRIVYTTPPANSPVVPEGWIKCIDYKPERETDVQVYCSDTNEQLVAFHLGNGEFQYAQHEDTSITCHPSHWMPLPAAPENPL